MAPVDTPRIDIAWATGLFEGEGTMGVFGNGAKSKVTSMALIMSDEQTVRRFAAIVGIGSVYGPLNYKNSVKPLWRWRANRTYDCHRLIRRMWPLLGDRRREQARPIIERALARGPKLQGRQSRTWVPVAFRLSGEDGS
jgi:hypothetical protein